LFIGKISLEFLFILCEAGLSEVSRGGWGTEDEDEKFI